MHTSTDPTTPAPEPQPPAVAETPGLTRRQALGVGVLGAAAIALPWNVPISAASASTVDPRRIPRPFTRPFERPPVATFTAGAGGRPMAVIVQQPFRKGILDGLLTDMNGYGQFGRPATFPGPTIVAQRNKPIIVRQVNQLRGTRFGDVDTSTHLHGAPSLPYFDGYANDLTSPGQYKDYAYENSEDARTLWYHDHAVHETARNVYTGLAAAYVLQDDFDAELPSGEFDVPLVINDFAFDARGQLLLDDRSHSGIYGDVVLVNGVPWPVMPVQRRKYRFRVLDASISRAYRLFLSPGGSFTVLANDGGWLRAPVDVPELPISMAERYGVVIDFARFPATTKRVELRNRGTANSRDFDNTDKVMAFDLLDTPVDGDRALPPSLPYDAALLDAPTTGLRTRDLRFERSGGEWVINDRTWEDVEAGRLKPTLFTGDPRGENVPPGDTREIWRLQNNSGGWFHPIHVHLVDFLVLDRNGRPPGAFEAGPKDVVYLRENEVVRVMPRFGGPGTPNRTGRYMIHCHNTVHEDFDMMSQFRVGEDIPVGDPRGTNDPMARRAVPVPPNVPFDALPPTA